MEEGYEVPSDVSHIVRDIGSAKGVYYREQMFEERMAKCDRAVAKEKESVGDNAEVLHFLDEVYPKLKAEALQGLQDYKMNAQWEDDEDTIKRRLADVKRHGIRFMDRVEASKKDLEELIDKILANELYVGIKDKVDAKVTETRAELATMINGFNAAAAKDKFDDDKEKCVRWLKGLKQHGSRFMDRVEKERVELEELFEQMLSNDLYKPLLDEVQAVVTSTREEMTGVINGFKKELCAKEFEDDKDKAVRWVKNLKQHGTRFMDRVEKERVDLEELFEKMLANDLYDPMMDEVNEVVQTTRDDMATIINGFKREIFETKLEKTRDKAERFVKEITSHGTRFMDRVAATQKDAIAWLDALFDDEELSTPEATSTLTPLVSNTKRRITEIAQKLQEEVDQAALEKAVASERRGIKSAQSDFDRFPERAQTAFADAEKKLAEMQENWEGKVLLREWEDEFASEKAVFKANWNQKFLEKDADAAMRTLRDTVGGIKDNLYHSRWEMALDHIHKAGDLLQQFTAGSDFMSIPRIVEEVYEQTAKKKELEYQYTQKVVDVELRDALYAPKNLLDQAQDDINKYRFDMALEKLAKCKTISEGLRANSAYFGLERLDTYLSVYDTKYPAMCAALNAKILERECKEACGTVSSHWNEALDDFNHYRWEKFLNKLRQTEDGVKEVESESRFAGQPSLEKLLSTLDEQIPAKKIQYVEKMKQKDITEALRVARDLVNSAKGHFDHHRNESCLQELIQAKQMVKTLSTNEDFYGDAAVDEFVKSATTDLDTLKTSYDERVLSKEASDKTGAIQAALNTTRGYIDHHNEEAALKSLATAMDARALLAASTDIAHLKGVTEFLESSTTSIVELRTAINDKIAEREANNASRVVTDMLSLGEDHLHKSRWEMFVKTSSELRSYLANTLAIPMEKYDEATKQMKDMTTRYHAAVFGREVSNAIREVSGHLSQASDALNHHNPELFLKELNSAKDGQYSLETFTSESAEAQTAHDEHETKIVELNKRYESMEIKKQATDALHTATTTWRITQDAFNNHRYEQAQKNFRDTKRAVLTLACPAWIEAFPEVAEFVKAFDREAAAFTANYEATMIKREYTAKARELTDQMGAAESHFSHSRAEMMLKSIQETTATLELIKGNADWDQHSAELTAEITKRMSELKTKHAEKVLQGQLSDAKSKATAAIASAKDALFHTNFPVVLETLRDAKLAISDLVNNELFQGMPSVEEFFSTSGAEVNSVEADYASKFDAIALSAAKRSCTDVLSGAEHAFNQNNQEELLRCLFKAKALVNEIDGDEAFVAEYIQKVSDLAKKSEEKLFASEIDRRKRKISNTLSTTRDHLTKHRHQSALESLKESKGLVSALSSDDRFLSSDVVNTALTEFATQVDQLQSDITEALGARELSDHKREITDCVGAMERTYQHYLTDQFLKEAVKAKESLQRFADTYPNEQSFVDENTAKIQMLHGQFRDRELRGEISGLLRTVSTHWSNAESAFQHHDNKSALAAVNEAKNCAESLNDPRFEGDAAIETFFSTWKEKLDKFSSDFNDRTQRREIDGLRREFKDAMSGATTALDRQMFDVAVTGLATATTILDNLKELTAKELVEETSLVDTMKAAINEKAFAKEISASIHTCTTNMTRAQEQFKRFNPEGALDALSTAKDQANQLREDHPTVDVVVKFLAKFDADVHAFSKEFAEKTLQGEARDAVRSARDKLALVSLFLQRKCEDKALSNLREAKVEIAAMTAADSLLSSLDSVVAFVAEYQTLEQKVVAEFVASQSETLARALRTKLQALATVIKRGLDASVVYDVAFDTAQVLMEDDLAKSLPVVDDVLKEFAALGASIGKDIWKVVAGTGDSDTGGGGDGAITVLSLLGGAVCSAPITIVKKIKMGTEIDPDYYREYKIINDGVDGINQYLREMQRLVKGIDVNRLEKPWKAVWDPAERVESIMKRIQKDGINVINKSKPEDETLLAFMQGYATAGQHFVSNCNTWKLAGKIIDAVSGGKWIKESLQFAVKVMKDFKGKGPYEVDKGYNSALWKSGPISLAQLNHSLYDSDLALTAVTKWIPSAKAKLAEWVAEFGGYPAQQQLESFLEAKKLELLKVHAIHCSSAAILNGTFQQQNLKAYRKGLDAFPLARRDVVERMRGVYDEFWSTRTYEATPLDTWINVEDWHKDPSGPTFEVEDASWYAEPEYLTPAAAGGDIGKAKDEASSIHWSNHRDKFKGKIVFSKQGIDRETETDSAFANEFEFGKDKVCGRAYWPHAISNYAIGKDDKGKPIFGPEKVHHHDTVYLQLLLFVSIDGTRIVREGTPGGAVSFFEMRNQPSKRDSASNYAAFSQSCRMYILANGPTEDIWDQWERDAHRIGHHCHASGEGKKQIDVDLCFRWVSTQPNVAGKIVFPYRTTPISEPIASGGFTLNIPKNVVKPHFFPLSKAVVAAPDTKSAAIKEFLTNSSDWGKRGNDTEQPINVSVFGDFYISDYEWYEIVGNDKLVKKPASYGLNCTALFYRSPSKGWKCESLAAFELTAYARVAQDQAPKIPPVSGGVGVGTHAFFDVFLLSEEEMKEFTRCPERMRRGHY